MTPPNAPAVPVIVIGAHGRLGAFARDLLSASPEFDLVGEYDSGDAWLEQAGRVGAQLAFEATRAGLGAEHATALLDAGLRPVIATSGVTLEQNAALDAHARELGLGGLVVPNLSLGIMLLERACREFAAHLPDASILEEHRPEKVDAPSATALELARAVAAARGSTADADHAEVPIESVREAGRYAHHEVRLGAPGERLTLRHDMLGPEAFGPGILSSLRYARTATGMARGLAAALA